MLFFDRQLRNSPAGVLGDWRILRRPHASRRPLPQATGLEGRSSRRQFAPPGASFEALASQERLRTRRWLGANQRLRRAIMDENGGGTGVSGMRAMHKTDARHSIFIAVTLTGQTMADILEYQASDAQAKWEELLDEVERGRTVRYHPARQNDCANSCPSRKSARRRSPRRSRDCALYEKRSAKRPARRSWRAAMRGTNIELRDRRVGAR